MTFVIAEAEHTPKRQYGTESLPERKLARVSWWRRAAQEKNPEAYRNVSVPSKKEK